MRTMTLSKCRKTNNTQILSMQRVKQVRHVNMLCKSMLMIVYLYLAKYRSCYLTHSPTITTVVPNANILDLDGTLTQRLTQI